MTEVVYRLYETVDELTTVIENARSVPMSASCMVPRDHLLDLLDDLRESVADLPNVTVDSFEGLLVDYCRAHEIPVIVKGLRAVSDFEYELQMAQMNRELAGIETLFVPTAPQVGHLSSSLVKQIAAFGGDVSGLVPPPVDARLRALRAAAHDGGGAA